MNTHPQCPPRHLTAAAHPPHDATGLRFDPPDTTAAPSPNKVRAADEYLPGKPAGQTLPIPSDIRSRRTMSMAVLPQETQEHILRSFSGFSARQDTVALMETCRQLQAVGRRILWNHVILQVSPKEGAANRNPLSRLHKKIDAFQSIARLVRTLTINGMMFPFEDEWGQHCEMSTDLIIVAINRLPRLVTLDLFGISFVEKDSCADILSPRAATSVRTLSVSRFLRPSGNSTTPLTILPFLPKLDSANVSFTPSVIALPNPVQALLHTPLSVSRLSLRNIFLTHFDTAQAIAESSGSRVTSLVLEVATEAFTTDITAPPAPLVLPDMPLLETLQTFVPIHSSYPGNMVRRLMSRTFDTIMTAPRGTKKIFFIFDCRNESSISCTPSIAAIPIRDWCRDLLDRFTNLERVVFALVTSPALLPMLTTPTWELIQARNRQWLPSNLASAGPFSIDYACVPQRDLLLKEWAHIWDGDSSRPFLSHFTLSSLFPYAS